MHGDEAYEMAKKNRPQNTGGRRKVWCQKFFLPCNPRMVTDLQKNPHLLRSVPLNILQLAALQQVYHFARGLLPGTRKKFRF